MHWESFIIMTQETTSYYSTFEVDGIEYIHPFNTASVYVRPMMQLFAVDARLSPMKVTDNKPKNGLMDSEVDEEWVKEYWER